MIERPTVNPFTDPSVLPIHATSDPTFDGMPMPLQAALNTGLLEAHKLELIDNNVGLFLSKINYSVNKQNNLNLNLSVTYLEDAN